MKVVWSIRVGVAVGVLLTGGGCRSKAAPVPPPSGPLQYDDDDDAQASAGRDAGEPAPEARGPAGCKAGGAPWDGKQEGCVYEVAGCCYPDAKSACAAADCEEAACQILEFSPAQVTCRVR